MSFEELNEPTLHEMIYTDINFYAKLWFIPCANKKLYYLHRDGTIQEGTAIPEKSTNFFQNLNMSITKSDVLEVFTGYFGSLEEAIQARTDYYTAHDEKILKNSED